LNRITDHQVPEDKKPSRALKLRDGFLDFAAALRALIAQAPAPSEAVSADQKAPGWSKPASHMPK
jgi:hypothetical protein